MHRTMPTPDTPSIASDARERLTERAATVAVFVASAALYMATMCPTIYTQDGPELTAVAATWGVAHPPGYPLFTMVYGTLAHALPVGDFAWRSNVVTALTAAATIVVLFRAARLFGVTRVGAAAGALGIAVTRDWWLQALSTEVYALDGLLLACALVATLHVVRTPTARRLWVALGLAFGLSCGHRPVNAVFLLALLGWAEHARRSTAASAVRCYMRFLLAGLATTVVWAYLLLTASRGPAMNAGDPSSASRLWDVVTATAYARHWSSNSLELVLTRAIDLAASVPAQLLFTGVAAAAGFVLLRRHDHTGHNDTGRPGSWALLGFIVANLSFVALYNVPDGHAFLQPTWVAVAVLAGVGYDGLRRRFRVTAVTLALAVAPVALHLESVDLSEVRIVEEHGTALLDSAVPGSLVLTTDDTARNAMLYHQVVGGRARNVAIVDATASFAWHRAETRVRAPEFPLDGADADGWIADAAQDVLRDAQRGLYFTDAPDAHTLVTLLGDQVARRTVTVPSGLLYRVLLPADDASAHVVAATVTAAADRSFWPLHDIPESPRARHDAQLALITLRCAQARFLLAATYLQAGDGVAARPHLEAVAATDIDALEDVVIDEFGRAGAAPRRQGRASRCRLALAVLDDGTPPSAVLAILTAR